MEPLIEVGLMNFCDKKVANIFKKSYSANPVENIQKFLVGMEKAFGKLNY